MVHFKSRAKMAAFGAHFVAAFQADLEAIFSKVLIVD